MMRFFLTSGLILTLFLSSCSEKPKKSEAIKYLDSASIEVLEEELKNVLNPETRFEILSEGHNWTEGPLWLKDEEKLLFSDIPRNTVYSWSENDGVEIYLKPSGFTGENYKGSEPGANGLLLDSDGNLVLCQHGNRQVARMNSPLDQPKPEFISLADNFENKRLNSPNDAAYHSNGQLFFTDPPYGLAGRIEDPAKELDFQGVYRLEQSGEVVLLDDQMSRPNGIGLSSDESILYVANSDPDNPIWNAYHLDSVGRVKSKELFFDASVLLSERKGLPDGLKVHPRGYLFATGPGGVLLFNKEGKHLGSLLTGQHTSNVAFNSDHTILFMTADSYVLRLKLN
ncbi:SMP-30/gluconolactonase/LRE family protein [Lutimonas zeaxanthinifaciens]|uniref:SMP-30/gluconolactonase/LRE family protein n=1 Tax=Lutimonas zeaxanthinifaciens TaxID=3060215 RepID=UPI00265CD0D0|nr:SMP-30/gluconolactonase/LRE family protein [Lutimonas sp. YSD2104]WKK66254.1 SMP-30/gluconolactonase/LRE family protein [Lutimonas sp. YSD2104]